MCSEFWFDEIKTMVSLVQGIYDIALLYFIEVMLINDELFKRSIS